MAAEAAAAEAAAAAAAAAEVEADTGRAAAKGWTEGAEEAAEVPGGEAGPSSSGTGESAATAGPLLAEAVRASGRLRRAFVRVHRGWAQLEHAAATRSQA